jgi:hypothetical protein
LFDRVIGWCEGGDDVIIEDNLSEAAEEGDVRSAGILEAEGIYAWLRLLT